MKRICFITILALTLHGCALFNSSKSTTVPFRLLNNHILMPVVINGEEMEFIFDSSGQSILVVDKSHWNTDNPAHELSSKTIASQWSSITIEIGDATLSDVSAETVTLNNNAGFPDADSVYFDGVIGHHLLKKYIVEINYDTQLITLTSRSAFNKKRPEEQNSWSSLPMNVIAGRPFISMPITLGENGRYLDFALNTGSSLDLKLPRSALTKELIPEYSYTFTHFDLSGIHKFQVFPIDRTFLGDHPKIWPLIHVPVNDNSGKQYGMVGNAILSRFNLIIDIDDETLYFQENQRHSIKNFPDRSGLSIVPHTLGAMVTSIASPAVRLLKVNDIIQSYEGITITEATFDSFRLMLSSEAEQLQICWLREQKRQCGNLTLAYRM